MTTVLTATVADTFTAAGRMPRNRNPSWPRHIAAILGQTHAKDA